MYHTVRNIQTSRTFRNVLRLKCGFFEHIFKNVRLNEILERRFKSQKVSTMTNLVIVKRINNSHELYKIYKRRRDQISMNI